MYKIKPTGEQVDRLLKNVFDSTLQSKNIDVIENGVIEVIPDEGYLGLAKVSINVEVPTIGDAESADRIYFDGTTLYQSNYQEILYHLTLNVYRLDAPLGHVEEFGFRLSNRFNAYNEYKYVSFPNNIIMPNIIMFGSGGLMPNPNTVGQSMTFYEFLEEMNTILGDIPINEIKNAEVAKEEVEAWYDAP